MVGAPLVYVRRPHVEGHRRDLEEEPDQQESHADDEQRGPLGGEQRRRQLGKGHLARRAVKQGDAVEEEARREGPEQEVLERALVGRRLLANQPGEHVETDGHRLQPDEQRDEAARAGEGHHARHGEQNQRVNLPVVVPDALQVRHRECEAADGARQNDEVGDGRRPAPVEVPGKGDQLGIKANSLQTQGDEHSDARQPRNARMVILERIPQHHGDAHGSHDQDRERGEKVSSELVVHEESCGLKAVGASTCSQPTAHR